MENNVGENGTEGDAMSALPHHLDSFYIENTPTIKKRLEKSGYLVRDGAYQNREYYEAYPYLLMHEGHIEYCHDRHLNRFDLYGKNLKIELVDNEFILRLEQEIK